MLLLAQLAVGGDRLAQAADPTIRSAAELDRERQARVDPAVTLAHVGQRRRQRLVGAPGRGGSTIAARKAARRAPGAPPTRCEQHCARLGAAEQLERAASARATSSNASRRGRTRGRRRRRVSPRRRSLAARSRQRLDQVGVVVDGPDLGARARRGASATRPVPQPRSSDSARRPRRRAPPRAPGRPRRRRTRRRARSPRAPC